jgi:outer membrane protein TolC
VGAAISNENYTWGLDVAGVPRVPSSESKSGQRLGRFGDEVALGGPDPGWFTGLQLRIPVFEGYARKGRQIEARAFLNAVKAALADQKDRVELGVRQSYRVLAEQKFQVELAQEQVGIERERFQIEEELRNVGRITDDQLETFRRTFFEVQDDLFSKQEALIERQEDLRLAIRYFK